MKKVLIFSTAYLPLIGGAEIAVKEITDRLGDNFFFDLICARINKGLPERERVGRVNVYRVGWGWGKIDKLLLPWRGALLARKLHCQEPYSIVWAIMASFGGLATLFFKKKYPVVPFLLTLQEGDAPEHIASRTRWLGKYFREIFSRADLITAISKYLKDFALRNGASCPIEVVPNGVDLQKFSIFNFQFSKKEFKDSLGISGNEKIVITVSRLAEKNGIADLIEAIDQLTPKNPSDSTGQAINNKQLAIKLFILGTGELENKLKDKVKDLKLEDKILFFGNVPNDEVPRYLAIADAFVRPSLSEGLGTSFLEAMAAGVPIIGTRVGGIQDFLRDGETGLFCETANYQSIAEKIKLLLNDDNLRQNLIISGQKLVLEQYDWNKIIKRMEFIFNSLSLKS